MSDLTKQPGETDEQFSHRKAVHEREQRDKQRNDTPADTPLKRLSRVFGDDAPRESTLSKSDDPWSF